MEAICTPMHCIIESKAATPQAHTGALYLGSLAAILEPELLHAHHITHIVQVFEMPWDTDGFAFHRIDMDDSPSAALLPHLAPACDYIRAALARGENVLVHCHQGVSRSASIVIAYLIRDRGMGYDAAYEFAKSRRACIRPNPGFVATLREWEVVCKTDAAERCSHILPIDDDYGKLQTRVIL
ncbi:protein-tyrosine phosphatase-like protein [Mycena capillaripes]|nr:protein-tyrosine phosphatase-like protein [Mycena capillaripes]